MPTGYTAKIADGTMTDFSDFAMTCARAFGALMELRDDMTVPIPESFSASNYHAEALAKAQQELAEFNYHAEALAKAQQELAEFNNMDDAESARRADAEFTHAMEAWEQAKREREAKRVRYQTMLEQVKAWAPPSKDHQGLKDFMMQQLAESMTFDCNHDDERWIPKRLTVDQWRKQRWESLGRDVSFHDEKAFKERKRAAERTMWVKDLRDSLAALATSR